jgi:hypothetical protein
LPFPLSVIRTSLVLLSVVFIPQHVYNILRIVYNNHEGVFFIILSVFSQCTTSVIVVANAKYMHDINPSHSEGILRVTEQLNKLKLNTT